MTREEACRCIGEVLEAYFGAAVKSCEPYGNGHINDTFLVVADRRYILQRMNHTVFPHPDEVMENILGVTAHLRSYAKENGGDVERCTLCVVPTREGEDFYRDSIGMWWRVYEFCERTVTRERVESVEDFVRCAEAFGRFGGLLANYPAETLHEPIARFHDTPDRYRKLMAAVERDAVGRASTVQDEIAFAMARETFAQTLERAREEGRLPLRVTHNDTKLNNILFDETTAEAICVIDLDTVMPGYSVNDFGDSIRFGANTAAEDETDLSKVSLDLSLFAAYAEGFIRGSAGRLGEEECALLPIGAMMMTFECGMRFLTDYLDGDVYFRTHYPTHNLDRCRNQFALLADMERKLEQMRAIVAELMK